MATRAAVNQGSQFCRHCGGPITARGGFAWCQNIQPLAECDNLTHYNRLFCEHCCWPNPGPGQCPNPRCGRIPTLP